MTPQPQFAHAAPRAGAKSLPHVAMPTQPLRRAGRSARRDTVRGGPAQYAFWLVFGLALLLFLLLAWLG